jgi:SecD/SecF fusion protein
VITDEHVIARLAEANPVRESGSHTPQEQAEAERILRRVLDDAPSRGSRRIRRPGRPRAGVLVPVASLLVVLVVAGVLLRTGGSATTTGSTPSGGLRITFRAEPSPQVARITAAAMARTTTIMRSRVRTLGRGFTVTQSGASEIVVTGPRASAAERQRVTDLAGQTAQLFFYDWEANALTLNGKPAAEGLIRQERDSVILSSGGAAGQPGVPGAGGLPLYQAAKLAAKQPSQPLAQTQSRKGPAYYFFGAPGSAACAAAAKAEGTLPVHRQHCLLNGPVSRRSDLYVGLPAGVTKADGELVAVPQGTVVLQATDPSASDQISPGSPSAEFFVLKDHVALLGNDITNPRAGTDQSGQPDVTFGFNGTGQRRFEAMTREVARRGANVSVGGATFNQHFAVALDNQLVTVPQIDFRQYPDGVIGGRGADISGGLTAQSAKDIATELRLGALPLNLKRLGDG